MVAMVCLRGLVTIFLSLYYFPLNWNVTLSFLINDLIRFVSTVVIFSKIIYHFHLSKRSFLLRVKKKEVINRTILLLNLTKIETKYKSYIILLISVLQYDLRYPFFCICYLWTTILLLLTNLIEVSHAMAAAQWMTCHATQQYSTTAGSLNFRPKPQKND